MLFFSIYDKSNEVIAEKPPGQWRHQALGRLELTLVVTRQYLLLVLNETDQ